MTDEIFKVACDKKMYISFRIHYYRLFVMTLCLNYEPELNPLSSQYIIEFVV